jgi:twitching motility protein PilT
MVDRDASDLHLTVPSPPVFRIDGVLMPQEDLSSLAAEDIESVLTEMVSEEQRAAFRTERELDFV